MLMRTPKRTREIKDLSTDELLDFMLDLQRLCNPFFKELRNELSKRARTAEKPLTRGDWIWKSNTDSGGGHFVNRRLKK